MKLMYMTFKYPVLTSIETDHFPITKTKLLVLCSKLLSVNSVKSYELKKKRKHVLDNLHISV